MSFVFQLLGDGVIHGQLLLQGHLTPPDAALGSITQWWRLRCQPRSTRRPSAGIPGQHCVRHHAGGTRALSRKWARAASAGGVPRYCSVDGSTSSATGGDANAILNDCLVTHGDQPRAVHVETSTKRHQDAAEDKVFAFGVDNSTGTCYTVAARLPRLLGSATPTATPTTTAASTCRAARAAAVAAHVAVAGAAARRLRAL